MQEQSVFNRLGAAIKRPATSTTTDSDTGEPEDACEYAGVQQPSRVKKKKIDDKSKATPATMKGTSVRARLGRGATILAMEILRETESQYLSNDKWQENQCINSTCLCITGPQPTTPKITEGILSPEAELNPILKTKQVANATSTTKSKSCR